MQGQPSLRILLSKIPVTVETGVKSNKKVCCKLALVPSMPKTRL